MSTKYPRYRDKYRPSLERDPRDEQGNIGRIRRKPKVAHRSHLRVHSGARSLDASARKWDGDHNIRSHGYPEWESNSRTHDSETPETDQYNWASSYPELKSFAKNTKFAYNGSQLSQYTLFRYFPSFWGTKNPETSGCLLRQHDETRVPTFTIYHSQLTIFLWLRKLRLRIQLQMTKRQP